MSAKKSGHQKGKCPICGKGPYQRVNSHISMVHKDEEKAEAPKETGGVTYSGNTVNEASFTWTPSSIKAAAWNPLPDGADVIALLLTKKIPFTYDPLNEEVRIRLSKSQMALAE